MKIKFNRNLTGALLFLTLSAAIILLIPSQIKVVSDDVINSASFPGLIALIMGACSLYLVLAETVKIIRKQPVEITELDLRAEGRTAVVILLLILFLVLQNFLHFWISASVFSALLMFFMGTRKWWKYAIVFSVIISVSLLFTQVLNVTLP